MVPAVAAVGLAALAKMGFQVKGAMGVQGCFGTEPTMLAVAAEIQKTKLWVVLVESAVVEIRVPLCCRDSRVPQILAAGVALDQFPLEMEGMGAPESLFSATLPEHLFALVV
jgi:hypothetical protein